ncbi:helix-turn-helix domain-containing protein [Micromonospora sp. R77]|uniref:helix-turn-helix domain-containing protein n=1 Tax=Micromonospora sp. R77 TaxID=2925836 RepID=UPI0035B38C73
MSVEAVTWALTHAPDVPPSCLAVLIGLANHADDSGRGAFPRQERLAFYARKTVRSVQTDLKTLESLGLIRRGDQTRAAFLAADRRPVVWDLALERRRPLPVPQESLVPPQPDDCRQPASVTGTRRADPARAHQRGEASFRTGRSTLRNGAKPASERGEAHIRTRRSPHPNGVKCASDEPSLTINKPTARPLARSAIGAPAPSPRKDQCSRHRGNPARNCGPCRAETLGGLT